MNISASKTSLIALATAALLSAGVTAASAQNFTRPVTDIRALEAPIDVTPSQLRAQRFDGGTVYQGRSVAGPAVVDGLEGQDR